MDLDVRTPDFVACEESRSPVYAPVHFVQSD